MRKLFTKDWIHVSSEFFSPDGPLKLHIVFLELLLKDSNPKKWGDHQKKKYPLKQKNNEVTYEEAFQNQLKSFGGSFNGSNEEEMGRQKRKEVL